MTIPKRVCTCCSDSGDTTTTTSSNIIPIVDLQWCIIMNDINHNSYVQFVDTTETNPIITNNNNNNRVTKPIINNIQLIKNFEKYGYSPIRIRWNITNEQQQEQSTTNEQNHQNHHHNHYHCPTLSSSAIELLQQYTNWKSLHSELFQNEVISNFHKNNNNNTANVDIDTTSIRYIPSESGSPGTFTPECKQSWEYQYNNHDNNTRPKSTLIHDDHNNNNNNNNNNNTNQQNNNILKNRLQGWSEILHTIIYHIMYELHLPIETLIAVQQHSETDKNHNDTSQGNDDQQQQSIDLLRAFRYDPIDKSDCTETTTDNNKNENVNKQQEQKHEQEQLGSSPHTDWGSWTVVWQDDTYPSCLQTYCYSCHQWNNLSSIPSTNNDDGDHDNDDSHLYEANFIVHVGDLTSLCIRHSLEKVLSESTTMQEDTTTTTKSMELDHHLDISNLWPSPRHRVLSPLYQYRHSLVYFVYPPKSITPTTIIDSLVDWCRTYYISVNSTRKVDNNMLYIPYEDYSILYDQSATAVVNVRKDDCTTNNNEVMIITNQHHQQHLLLWKSIQSISIDTILKDKWKQVQR